MPTKTAFAQPYSVFSPPDVEAIPAVPQSLTDRLKRAEEVIDYLIGGDMDAEKMAKEYRERWPKQESPEILPWRP